MLKTVHASRTGRETERVDGKEATEAQKGELSVPSRGPRNRRVNAKNIKSGKNHKSDKSLFKSCYFDDRQIGSKLKSFSKTVRKSDAEVSDADYNYLLKSPNDHLSSVGFEVLAPNDFNLESNEVQKRRQTLHSVQINEFSANMAKPNPNKAKTGKCTQSQNSSKDAGTGPKSKKEAKRLPPILNKSINGAIRKESDSANWANGNKMIEKEQSREEVFEYSNGDFEPKETDKKARSFQTNLNRQQSLLDKSQPEFSSTLKNQPSMDSALPISKMLREVDLKRPGSFVIEKDFEDHLISFNLDHINELEFEKLLMFMLKYHRRKVVRKQANDRQLGASKLDSREAEEDKQRLRMRKEVDSLAAEVGRVESEKNEVLAEVEKQKKRIMELEKEVETLRGNQKENREFYGQEMEVLVEENLLFREHFENVIRQVLEFADKMAQRKVENSNESHVKIIGELVENINLMIRKINKDFNSKLAKLRKTVHLKIRELEEANLDLERENKYLRRDVDHLRQSASREQVKALVEQQISAAMTAYKEKMNSKLNFVSERVNQKLKRLRQEPSIVKPPPLKIQNLKAKAKERASNSYRQIELDTFEGFHCSPTREKETGGKSMKFLKKLFNKERPFRLQENTRQIGTDRLPQSNLDLINKKIRRSYRTKKHNTNLDFDIKKYQSSQPDNYIEESRFPVQQSKSPFSKTERKDLPGSLRLGFKNNFINEFNKITKQTKSHLKKKSFQIPSGYKMDSKSKIKKLRLVDKSGKFDF